MRAVLKSGICVVIGYAVWVLGGCVKSREYNAVENNCSSNLKANATFLEVKDYYVDKTVQIQEDLIIEGYVISSDESGNFFNVLYIQDKPVNPTAGFQIEIDMRDSHLLYPVGAKVFIRSKGLYLGKTRDVFKLGGAFTAFGNITVGRLPALIADQHIIVACGDREALEPQKIALDELAPGYTHTLVQFSKVEIVAEELGEPFAIPREETARHLVDCRGNGMVLWNSGFSDFQSNKVPEGNGTIVGVLLQERNDFKLAIRSLKDIDFAGSRCAEEMTEGSSTDIFISELADPDNDAKARFLELYNSSDTPVSLNGWMLRRYTNDNLTVGATVDLSNQIIEAQGTLVLSPNAAAFEAVYGFLPDMEVGRNSPADSNGDDTIELVGPLGQVIDIFGVVGEDGSGTDHEFENGRAVRNPGIIQGNARYDADEWTIYNDSGGFGTLLQPQIAPQDFTPGTRN